MPPADPAQNPPSPSSLRLTTPGSWLPIDLDPRTRTGSLGRLVNDRLGDPAGDDAERATTRRELTAALRGFARDAAETGAVYAAILVEQVAGESVQLSLMVSYAALPPPVGTADPDQIPAPRTPPPAEDQTSPPSTVDTPLSRRLAAALADPAGELTECALPIGPAVRLVTNAPDTEHLLVQYAVPVPGAGASDIALVLSFGSPQATNAEALLSLFEAIARDARWVAGTVSR